MNYLKTYRNYLLINKLLDLIIYLVIFTIFTTFSFMIYYTTKSFFILLVIITLIYVIGIFIAKLFEIKILLPSIIYIVISMFLISFICYYEKESINLELTEFLLQETIFLFIISLIITLYKYETPVSIYYKVKDYFNAISYSKKIKTKFLKNKNPNTDNPYSTNLLFEKTKLLHKLNEEYKKEYNDIENNYIKQFEKLKNASLKLNDLENQLTNVEQKLKRKNTGAQDYELCCQRKSLKEKIFKQREITVNLNIKVNNLLNRKNELKNTYEKNLYYISNGYNIRYMNYTNTIKERLSLTKFNLTIVPFDTIEKNLEEKNEKFTI